MGPFEGLSRDMHDICGAECGGFHSPTVSWVEECAQAFCCELTVMRLMRLSG